jgi:hypothetical protein
MRILAADARGQFAADLVAVDHQEVTVKNDHVIVVDGQALQRRAAVERNVHGRVLAAQAVRYRLREWPLVFHHEYPHVISSVSKGPRGYGGVARGTWMPSLPRARSNQRKIRDGALSAGI